MSSCLMPYRVDLDTIRALPSTSDTAVVDTIVERWWREISHSNQGDEEEIARAMRDIARGQIRHDGSGDTYGFALRYLCEHFGAMLVNDQFCPTRLKAIEALDADVRGAGVTDVLPLSLVGWMPPIPFPSSLDLALTTVDRQTCRTAAAQYTSAIPALAESGHRAAAVQITSWLRQCRDLDQDLVVFYL
jgi:hypothetical protein